MPKKQRSQRVHYPPGSLVYRGSEQTALATARIIRYNSDSYEEEVFAGDVELLKPREDLVTWIHVNGIHDVDLIGVFGNIFQLHNLLLEDILSTETLPKHEDFDNCMFASLNAMSFHAESQELTNSNVSIVLFENLVISFQESGPDFNAILHERLAENKGVLRTRKADYLFYRFIDVIVDEYKTVLDHIEDLTEDLEETSIQYAGDSIVGDIRTLRRQLNKMRRNVGPLRVMVGRLYQEPGMYFKKQTMHFLRDLLDDIEQVNQRIETSRENLLNIMDINYTNISMKTNEVMRVLTIVATMFIPLTFAAGIYGMNFEYMPELQWKYAYPAFWGLMLVMIGMMLFYFRRNKWL